MDLFLDTSGADYEVSRSFEQRTDRDGNPRRDKMGGTGLPLYAVQLVVWTNSGSETILVSVPIENPPTLSQRQSVTIEGLQAIPWVSDGKPKVAFRARAINPVSTGKSTTSSASTKTDS